MDVGDRDLMRSRSWRWGSARILGLLDKPVSYSSAGFPVYRTRLAAHFYQRAAIDQAAAAAEAARKQRR